MGDGGGGGGATTNDMQTAQKDMIKMNSISLDTEKKKVAWIRYLSIFL